MRKLSDIKEIADLLLEGKVGVLPTDTIYGLVAVTSDRSAVHKIYELKNREEKPGTIVAASVGQLENLGIKRSDIEHAQKYWPGAVSVVLPDDGPDYLDLDGGTLAVRIPNNQFLLEVLAQTGPLVTSSANLTRQPVANNLDEAYGYFGDQVDFYVDGGDLSAAKPSTIVKIVDDNVEIIRQGAVEIK